MDFEEKSFDFAAETTKQLLTLSAGIVALTVSFAHDLIQPGSAAIPYMIGAWIAFAVSLLMGVLTFMAMTGVISHAARRRSTESESADNTTRTVYAANIRLFAILQIWTFFIAIGLTVTFGIIGFTELRPHSIGAIPTVGKP